MTQPFLKTFYVDPTFIGSSTGSQDEPFISIADAITAAPILEGCVIILPPNQTITENVSFLSSDYIPLFISKTNYRLD
jgi:hypothetical protein